MGETDIELIKELETIQHIIADSKLEGTVDQFLNIDRVAFYEDELFSAIKDCWKKELKYALVSTIEQAQFCWKSELAMLQLKSLALSFII